MKLLQRARCQGCAALKSRDKQTFTCMLKFKMSFSMVSKVAVRPQPEEPCYKPISEKELLAARKLL